MTLLTTTRRVSPSPLLPWLVLWLVLMAGLPSALDRTSTVAGEEPAPPKPERDRPPAEIYRQAIREFERGDTAAALATIGKLVNSPAHRGPAIKRRARFYDQLRQFDKARQDYDQAIILYPDDSSLWHGRGSVRFKSGDIRGSIADFDEAIQLNPALEQRHWQRGLSYYYAEQYDAGAKQFELYQQYDAADVENVVWRCACQAKFDGVDKARADMMTLSQPDRRVPMMQIDALFRGKAEPSDVFAAAEEGTPEPAALNYQKFYAHLYVGLYFEMMGDSQQATTHILAADKHKNDHYMWDVAHVHAERIRKKKAQKSEGQP